jgi:YfiH family protein
MSNPKPTIIYPRTSRLFVDDAPRLYKRPSTSAHEDVRIVEMAKLLSKARTARKSTTLKRATPSAKTPEWKLRRAGGLQILEAPALTRLRWLTHGFSTRPGGASEMPAAEPQRSEKAERVLNLGFADWDLRERVLANRNKFFLGVGADKMRVVALRQIHSDVVHVIRGKQMEDSTSSKGALSGDALITREPGVLLMVQTADCVPILLADTRNKAVAAIHSGWRGTLARIPEKTLGQMRMEFGTDPAHVVAAVGPAIGRCCYEVGEEVVQKFEAKFPHARDWFVGPYEKLAAGESDPNWLPWLTMRPPGHAPPPLRAYLDLMAANRAILAGAGVPERQISSAGFCTACRSDLFFSYRRERTTGRLVAAIGIR